MGSTLSSLVRRVFSRPEVQIMMIGLDASGKTSIMYRLTSGVLYLTTPTIGFNVETLEYKNVKMTIWDVGGQEKIRPLWRKCWREVDAVVFVVDSTDRDRLEEASDELRRVLAEDHLKDSILLVLVNKQDKIRRMTSEEVMKIMRLPALYPRTWHIEECSAVTGAGLQEGLHWLHSQFRKQRKR